MKSTKITTGALAVVAVSTFALFAITGVAYADDTEASGFSGFVTRVSEILGVEEQAVADAIEQAHEEGYAPKMMHGGKGPFMGGLTACIEVDEEALRELMHDSEGLTMGEVLTQLGVEDLDSVEQCLLDEKLSHIDEMLEDGRITQDEAIEKKAFVESNDGEFLDHEVGSGPKGMPMGEGHRRGMRFDENQEDVATESGVQ